MKNWNSTLIKPDTGLREVLRVLDLSGSRLLLVVDDKLRLLGVISDGDVRRALLGGIGLDETASRVMNTNPTTVPSTAPREQVEYVMRSTELHQLPVVGADRTVVGLARISDYITLPRRDNWVVIMAGGLGSRLNELTRETPKPMLKIGSRPLLETIVRSYADQGFHHFYLAVNYKADQIEAHFGDGSALGVDIRYLHEEQRMGTAGALSLLDERPISPLIVTNADLLTKED